MKETNREIRKEIKLGRIGKKYKKFWEELIAYFP
jgi:hypothetical protein